MSSTTMKCPFCNGENKICEGSEQMTCEFCGAQFSVNGSSSGKDDMVQSLIRQADSAASDRESFDFASKACEMDRSSCDAWIAKAKYALDLDTRRKAIDTARGLAKDQDEKNRIGELVDMPAVVIEWDGTVCDWQCVFAVDGKRVHLDKTQKMTRFFQKGVYEFSLTAPQKNKAASKKVMVKGNGTLRLWVSKGLMSSTLSIDFKFGC